MILYDLTEEMEKIGYEPDDSSDKRWLDDSIDEIFDGILTYLMYLQLKAG